MIWFRSANSQTVSTIALAIEAAREGALPGREAAMINAVLRAARRYCAFELLRIGDLYRRRIPRIVPLIR
jgi:hypothetical protein